MTGSSGTDALVINLDNTVVDFSAMMFTSWSATDQVRINVNAFGGGDVTGTNQADILRIVGTGGVLRGAGGADSVFGGISTDELFGDAGDDFLQGGGRSGHPERRRRT